MTGREGRRRALRPALERLSMSHGNVRACVRARTTGGLGSFETKARGEWGPEEGSGRRQRGW
jgi:hypothetical protein